MFLIFGQGNSLLIIQHVLVSISSYLNLIHPRSDIEEAAFWGNVVQQQDSVSFTEVGPGNTTEPTIHTIQVVKKYNSTFSLEYFPFIIKSCWHF